jgi:hypothetical protein
VVLYNIKSTPPPGDDFAHFELITGSVVNQLATATGPTSSGSDQAGTSSMSRGMPLGMKAGGSGTGSWQPLFSLEAGTGTGSSAGASPGGARPITSGSKPITVAPPTERQGASVIADNVNAPKSDLKRSEFILLFIWKEPDWKTGEIAGDSAAAQTAITTGGAVRSPRQP